jgi:hypothetical protein
MKNAWKPLVLLARLEVGYDGIIIYVENQVQAKGVTLPTDEATLIAGCVVEFHIFCTTILFCMAGRNYSGTFLVPPAAAGEEKESALIRLANDASASSRYAAQARRKERAFLAAFFANHYDYHVFYNVKTNWLQALYI